MPEKQRGVNVRKLLEDSFINAVYHTDDWDAKLFRDKAFGPLSLHP